MLIAGSRHLNAALDEYVAHYSEHRPHRAPNRIPPGGEIALVAVTDLTSAQIRRRMALGGLIRQYGQAA